MHRLTARAYWQATALLMCAHFAGWGPSGPLLVGLSVTQVVHAFAAAGLRALAPQVRLLYLAVLLAGALPGLQALHALQFGGVLALLVADYCLAARMLLLLPWNRRQRLSRAYVRAVLLTPPAPGPIAARIGSGATSVTTRTAAATTSAAGSRPIPGGGRGSLPSSPC